VTPLRFVVVLSWFVAAAAFVSGDEPSRTGPQTEKRFPPLKVPAGFKATLFACDPLIEYPSVIAAGPKANQLFVAIDYMTGLGEEIIRRDEIRLVEDTDGDGYADKATVYAKGFNSIQGLAYHDGRVYVMHAPFLTVLRDTKGTGAADERRELLTGEALTQRALAQPGNAERGRAVFFNVEKSLCLKCHRVADKGEPIGPELTGIGARFGRV
jgi:glucose/arabinose dehydrogenase